LQKSFRIKFGQFVQIRTDSHNTNNSVTQPRTIDALSLIPKDNLQGTNLFYALDTGAILARDNWIEIPINDYLIEKMKKIVAKEKNSIVSLENLSININNNHDIQDDNNVQQQPIYNAENIRLVPTENNNVYSDNIDENDLFTNAEKIVYEASHDDVIVTPANEVRLTNNNDDHLVDDDNNLVNDDVVKTSIDVGLTNNDGKDTNGEDVSLDQNKTNIIEDKLEGFNEIIQHQDNDNEVGQEQLSINNENNIEGSLQTTNAITNNVLNNSEVQQISTHNYNLRPRNNNFDVKLGKFVGMITQIEQQIRDIGPRAMDALVKELKQLVDKEVFSAVYKKDVPVKKNGKLDYLTDKSFVKVKRDDTVKGRTVVGGHKQIRELYDIIKELSSSTIKCESTLLILALAIYYKDIIIIGDVEGAYLNALLKRTIYMKFNKFEAEILCKINPYYLQFIDPIDGCLYVKLDKALYGCIESAKLFYELLKDVMEQYGFQVHPYDECVYYFENSNGARIIVGSHVDDLIITSNNEEVLEHFVKYLKS
jgi:hypothetical protein